MHFPLILNGDGVFKVLFSCYQ